MLNVLLLNGENVQTVCFAKALKKIGCRVSSICSTRLSSGYATRYLDKRFVAPVDIGKVEIFDIFFSNFLSKYPQDLLIPMGDESAVFLSLYKEKIEQQFGCKVMVPTYSIFELANDKRKLMDVCREYKIAHPRTHEVRIDNIDEAIGYVGLPAVIKPNVGAGAKGIVRVDTIKEVREKVPQILFEFGPSSLQEYVEHPDHYYNVMLYRNIDGKILGQTVIKIRRYFPLKGGSSCYCETVKHKALINECSRLLEILEWHGFADFDVLEDKSTGVLKIIEINPRVPSSLQAAFAAGINFAEIYICDYMDKDIPRYEYKECQQVRWFGLDMMWFIMSPQRFSFIPSWFKFFGKNVSYHDGAWNDPMPMIVGCLAGLKKYMDPSFRKAKLKA